jgi:hypothetical protein
MQVNDVIKPTEVAQPANLNLESLTAEMISARILHTLSIYPRLSMSMLQVGVGTGFPPRLWKPILEQLIRQGKVSKHQIAAVHPVTQRDMTYTVIALPSQAA